MMTLSNSGFSGSFCSSNLFGFGGAAVSSTISVATSPFLLPPSAPCRSFNHFLLLHPTINPTIDPFLVSGLLHSILDSLAHPLDLTLPPVAAVAKTPCTSE
jgi:hypothetical protein